MMRGEPTSKGPSKFAAYAPGDVVAINYQGVQAALMQVTKINRYSMEGKDGHEACWVTYVSDSDFRFYAQLGPNRQTVIRNVSLVKL